MANRPEDDPALAGLDDDLFDFDEVGELVAEVEGAEPERPAAPLPKAAPASAPEPVVLSTDGADFAPLAEGDLDEDLFDFDELFLDEPTPAPAPAPEPEPAVAEAAADDDAPAAEDWDAFELGTDEPTPATPVARPAQPAPRGAQRAPEPELNPVLQAAAAPEPARPVFVERRHPRGIDPSRAPEPVVLEEGPRRSRLIEVLVGCFLLVNTSLVVLAWRAGDDFRATLSEITGSLTGSTPVRAGGAPDPLEAGADPRPTTPTHELDPAPVAAQAPDMVVTTLDLARTTMEQGDFEGARRSLQRMLANQDRGVLAPEQVAEAEVLIARTYYLQGLAVRGEGSR